MYTFSYKGIEYKQEGPITKGKGPKITQRKITTTCSNCGKEITLNFSIFRKEVNKKGKFVCGTCRVSDGFRRRNPERYPALPENAKIISGLNKSGNLRKPTRVEIECEICHNRVIISYDTYRRQIIETGHFYCKSCKTKKFCLENYGVKNINQAEHVRKKLRKTCEERYGGASPFSSPEVREKAKKTNIERYGVACPIKTPDLLLKIRQHNIEKYGVEYPTSLEEVKEKVKKTCLERYGVSSPSQNPIFVEKYKQTNLKKYGVENPSQLETVKEKARKTCLERYGVRSYTQSEEYQKTAKKKYFFENKYFDSSWELAFYIYLRDNNIDFIYKPSPINYFDSNGKSHKYFPDFKIGDRLIEIKGDFLLDEEGRLKDLPSGGPVCPKEKQICMDEHNVIVLSRKEINPYLKYVRDNYGKNYLRSFKKVNS